MTPRKRPPDPRKTDRHLTTPLRIRLPKGVKDALMALAKTEKRAVNALVVEAIREKLGLPLDGGPTTG